MPERKHGQEKKTASDPSKMTPSQAHAAIQKIMAAAKSLKPGEYKDAETGVLAMDVSSGLVSVLDMRLRLEWSDDDMEEKGDLPTSYKLLAMIAQRLNSNQQVEILA